MLTYFISLFREPAFGFMINPIDFYISVSLIYVPYLST